MADEKTTKKKGAKPDKKAKPEQAAPAAEGRTPSGLVWRTEEWEVERYLACHLTDYNPKSAEPDEIVRLAESYRTFGVGRSMSVRDDDLVLDGHQSHAALGRLYRGEHKLRSRVVPWDEVKERIGKIAVRVVSGMSDAVARAYIAAVTHNRVEVDHDRFAELILDIDRRVKGATGGDDVDALLGSVAAIGLSPSEFTDYVDLAQMSGDGGGKGGGGPPSPGVPKLTLEFTDPDMRDRVKRRLAEQAKSDKEPHGNVLARVLQEHAKAAKGGKQGGKAARG